MDNIPGHSGKVGRGFFERETGSCFPQNTDRTNRPPEDKPEVSSFDHVRREMPRYLRNLRENVQNRPYFEKYPVVL